MLPSLVLTSFAGQEASYFWGHLDGDPGVKEEGAGAASEHIFDGASHLFAGGPNALGGDVGKIWMELACQVGEFIS